MRLLERLKSVLAQVPHPVMARAVSSINPMDRRRTPRIDARKGTRVLVVDDSPTLRGSLCVMLASAGYITIPARNGERGLFKACFGKPDLIVLDIEMPGMDGIDTLRGIRRDPLARRIPVILIGESSQSFKQLRDAGMEADGYLKKPVTRQGMFQRISTLLDEEGVPRRNPG
jgi:CheY-like chemotaxis protein